MVDDIPAERWPEGGAHNNAQCVNGLRHGAFFCRPAFGNNGLRSYQQRAAAHSLQKPEDNELGNVVRVAAEEGAHGKQNYGSRKVIAPPKLLREPAGHGHHNNVGQRVGGNHPADFVYGGAQVALHVIKRHVYNGGIDNFEQCAKHRRNGYDNSPWPIFDQRCRWGHLFYYKNNTKLNT